MSVKPVKRLFGSPNARTHSAKSFRPHAPLTDVDVLVREDVVAVGSARDGYAVNDEHGVVLAEVDRDDVGSAVCDTAANPAQG